MKGRAALVSWALHLLALGNVLAFAYLQGRWAALPGIGMALMVSWLFAIVIVGIIEAVALGVARRSFWAWVAAACMFGLYLPSLFMPIAVCGLWALVAPGTRAAFGISVAPPRQAVRRAG